MKMVVLDGYTLNPGDISWDELEKRGILTVYERTAPEDIITRAKEASVLFTNKVPLTASTLAQLPGLKYIGVLATGYNIVDTEAAKKQNIIVSNAPGYSTSSVAQLVFAFILEQAHRIQWHSDAVRQGDWTRSPDFCFWKFPLTELAGKTIGIIGFGTIGQQVANIAEAFGMNVIAQSRSVTDQTHRKRFHWVSLPELFAQSDFISIHCPLTEETKGLINRRNLSLMKRSAFLINTSRGPIVNDIDLAEALNNELISGAGIDVLSVEPPGIDNPLLKARNALITPHFAWATKEARTRLMDITVKNLDAFLQARPRNVVNS